jgi:hypothetical protein
MLTVVATFRTGPSATRGVAYLLARHAAASEQEPGCRQFLVHQALDKPGPVLPLRDLRLGRGVRRAPAQPTFPAEHRHNARAVLIERECGFAGYIDNTMRDGEGSFRLIPAAATDGGAR